MFELSKTRGNINPVTLKIGGDLVTGLVYIKAEVEYVHYGGFRHRYGRDLNGSEVVDLIFTVDCISGKYPDNLQAGCERDVEVEIEGSKLRMTTAKCVASEAIAYAESPPVVQRTFIFRGPFVLVEPPRFNGGQVCDMKDGPCSCGAWH